METTPARLDPGLGLVLVEFSYQYEGRDGSLVQIRPNERYELLSKATPHWWQVRSGPGSKPFYVPAKYVRQLPPLFPPDAEATPTADAPPPSPLPLPVPSPTPVPTPVPPKTQEDTRKPSDQVVIRLRPEHQRRSENRMSTFGFVPLETVPTATAATPWTANGSGTTNMADSLRATAPEDSGTQRHQPIPVETPRAPPTLTNHAPQLPDQEIQKEEELPGVATTEEAEPEKLEEEPSDSEEEEPISEQLTRTQPRPEEHSALPQEAELREESSSHIYESIQDLNIDLDALIGQNTKLEVEAPPPAQEVGGTKPESPVYANVNKLVIPPPPPDPAPPPPDSTHSLSGSSSSGLSPTSPLSPVDQWETHTDSDSGKLFYFHPLTRRSTWTPPTEASPASSQEALWERLVDEVSGRFYFFNPKTGATSWTLPQPQSSSSSSCPVLPEEDYPQDSVVDDSVFTMVSPRPRAEPTPDPGPTEGLMGNGVSEGGARSRGWRRSVNEERLFPVRRHVSDLTDTAKLLAPDGTQLSDRLKLRRNLSNRSADARQPHGHLLEKAGIINKTKVCDNGKKLRKNWSQSWTVLHGGILTFHRDPKSAPSGPGSKASQIVPEFTVDLRGASVSWANHKSSKKNVLELKTRQGCEFLIQYDTDSIINDWFKVIADAIAQLEGEGSEDSEDSDREDKSKRSSSHSSSSDPDQRRVRHKLRRFLQRRPTLQSVKEKGYIRDAVFGCHLDTLCHRENSLVPRFVQKCVRFVERHGLDTDGIYRVSGNLAVIQRLRHKADHEEQLDLDDGHVTEVHVVTGALKLFFRELPEPLFPFSSYDKFIAAIQLAEHSQRVSYIKDLVSSLPLPNHSTMELLFTHLQRVIAHSDSNRMSVQSLAIVFGPTLLRPLVETNLTVHMVFQSRIVELMLQEVSSMFTPPK